jgi:Fic family protein
MFFNDLRQDLWKPTFEWVSTTQKAADKINLPHEDYPQYVGITEAVLNQPIDDIKRIRKSHLLAMHEVIFADKEFAGRWRDVDVRVGLHRPPSMAQVADLMAKLEELYIIKNIEDLIEWYKDFETIHPFQDGNGRVGGVIVATYGHKLYPINGWFAPNQ